MVLEENWCSIEKFDCCASEGLMSGFHKRITAPSKGLAGGDAGRITGWTVLQAAGKGDKACAAIVEQAGNYLGLGLANLVNLFNPSLLVVDQRLSLAGQALLDQFVRVIRRQSLHHSAKGLLVRYGSLGFEACVLGAARIVFENYFEIPVLKPPRYLIEPERLPVARALATQATFPNAGGAKPLDEG